MRGLSLRESSKWAVGTVQGVNSKLCSSLGVHEYRYTYGRACKPHMLADVSAVIMRADHSTPPGRFNRSMRALDPLHLNLIACIVSYHITFLEGLEAFISFCIVACFHHYRVGKEISFKKKS